jgi:hypothetical protein
MAERPFGDGIVGGEVFDWLVGPQVDEEGVDLDEFAGRAGFAAFGEALGVALARADAKTPLFRALAQHWNGDDAASLHQPVQNAPGGRSRGCKALAPEEGRDLALAPHGIVEAHGFHRFGERGRPLWLAQAFGPAGLQFRVPFPAVQGGPGDA